MRERLSCQMNLGLYLKFFLVLRYPFSHMMASLKSIQLFSAYFLTDYPAQNGLIVIMEFHLDYESCDFDDQL